MRDCASFGLLPQDFPLFYAHEHRLFSTWLARRLVQVGIRTLNHGQRQQVERFGVETHEMNSLDLTSVGRDL